MIFSLWFDFISHLLFLIFSDVTALEMASVTLQILEGHERGRVFNELETPITIGREEDNHIRLNDDSVSRFHAKIQESDGHIILTDLQSTNGTRVNGFPAQLRVLQEGDQIWIGRCLLVFGPERDSSITSESKLKDEGQASRTMSDAASLDIEAEEITIGGADQLFPNGAPALPENMTPAQRAALSDMMAFFHAGLASIAHSAFEQEVISPFGDDDSTGEEMLTGMFMQHPHWQHLLSLEMNLARYLKNIADPEN